jgi:hypothetical protein
VVAGTPAGRIYVWDAATGTLLLDFKARGINAIAIDQQRARIVSAGRGVLDRTLRAWDLNTGTEIADLFPRGHDLDIAPLGVTKIQVVPNGHMYALRFDLRVWDVTGAFAQQWAVIRHPEGLDDDEPGDISSFDVDPLGKYLVTGHHDGTIAVRDIADGTILQKWVAHRESDPRVAWAPDGRWLASAAGRDRFVRVWPVEREE